ncbi:MAG: UDP-N-acetylglucosamine--N-acetylmuramyl-(pentapeptide) pyrophosphoryl-undecaprenol [Mycobacterium sp.]|nr:UDP-N-acetylglucosamine--N-acetylmuramyl-(pentapeptide) pyrophosphoryl-undecaprenol [Mycobacterium sp.]
MSLIARWVEEMRPCAMVVDVSVEVALFVRLLGVPVIVMTMPGERTDGPHMLVHQLADHIVAAWPKELYEPAWLRIHAGKTSYVGGISRFGDRGALSPTKDRIEVLVLGGMGGCEFDQATVDATAARLPEINWRTLGLRGGPMAVDPWPDICAADIVVTHGGQNCIADVAAARRPAVVLPQPRPFDEQHATAEALGRHGLAVAATGWPDASAWRCLLGRARASDPRKWEQWQTAGAAARAAEAIETVASPSGSVHTYEDRRDHHSPWPVTTPASTARRNRQQCEESRHSRRCRGRRPGGYRCGGDQ